MKNSAGKQEQKPIIVKFGNASVRIYRGHTRGYHYFQVADFSSGKRKLLTVSDEQGPAPRHWISPRN